MTDTALVTVTADDSGSSSVLTRLRDRVGGERVVVALLWLALAAVVFLNKFGTFTPDIKPEIYLAPGRSAHNLLFSWFEDQQLGLPNFNVGLAPVAGVVWVLHSVGFSPAMCMRLLRLALLLVGWLGATRVYGHVAGSRSSPVGRVLVGVLYVVNPYVVVAGDTLAILLPLALLPWQVSFLIRALETRRSWRWPAAFALTLVAMSGMNAGVVPLLQLVYVPAVVWYVVRRGTSPRIVVAALARCSVLGVLVSLYWLVPAIAASGVGTNVLNNSETMRGIAGPSSFAEVLRGLGLWVMYGRGPDGPWQPGFTPYLSNPLVIVGSFALPILFVASALVVRGAARWLAMLMVGVAAVVMVGLHPPAHPSPFGIALRALFDHVPSTGALRTTNKAGAVLVLGVALLVALAAGHVARPLSTRQFAAAAAALTVLVIGAAWPAFSGGLYSDRLTIPSYWKSAAAAVDAGSQQQRVWLVPGEVRSHYRWSQERVDDIDKSLLSRPSVVQYTIPTSRPESANFLTAIDTLMQEGRLPPGAVSAAARYMGAGDVLVRNDVVWEQTGGARPATVQEQVGSDAGLSPAGVFGRPGENTVSPVSPPLSAFEAALPPVQRYQVADSRNMLRIEPLSGSVLIDGDGWAFGPLVAAGLLNHEPAFRYLGDTSPDQLRTALRAGTRLVVTDTNRRRASRADVLSDSQGPLVQANEGTGPTRVLFDAASQTVLRVQGGTVRATSEGSVFGALPNAAAENAFDGDVRTAWLFGDFNNAVGQSIALHLRSPRLISRIHLVMRPRGPVTISRVRLRAGSSVQAVDVPPSGVVDVDLRPTYTDTVRLKVLRTAGEGINLVGVNEVGIPGVRITRVAQMPTRLSELSHRLGPADVERLARTPIDVVFSRARGTLVPDDDEETGLNRDFSLPQTRSFRVYGIVRPDYAATDEHIDELLGFTGNVTATSSSRLFDDPDVRASAAVDGNLATSWSPAGPVVGQWLTLQGKPRHVDHLDVVQPTAPVGTPPSYISRARLYLDGRMVADVPLRPGLTRVKIRPQTARSLKFVIAARAGSGFVHVSELRFGNARITQKRGGGLRGCIPVAMLDGRPVLMRPVWPLRSLGPTLFTGCGPHVTLDSGAHQLRSLHDWMPDELVLRDVRDNQPPSGPTVVGGATTTRLSPTHWRITATLPTGPQVVVLGQNYDPRWRATIDGRSAGRTVVADGYSAAWIVTAPGRHTLDIRFAPQRDASAALAVSGVAVLACAGLAFRGRSFLPPASVTRRRSRRGATFRRTRVGVVSPRNALVWMGVVATAWILGGLPTGSVALVLAAWHLWHPPRPRVLLRIAVGLLAICPLAFIVGNFGRWGEISPSLVLANEWPHWLAAAALLLLFVGVWRQDAADDHDSERLDPGTEDES